MGNSAWGAGYHKGFSEGAVRGGVIVGAVLVAADLTIRAVPWAYRKLRDRGVAKYEESVLSDQASSTDGEEINGIDKSE